MFSIQQNSSAEKGVINRSIHCFTEERWDNFEHFNSNLPLVLTHYVAHVAKISWPHVCILHQYLEIMEQALFRETVFVYTLSSVKRSSYYQNYHSSEIGPDVCER